jgi:ribose transport system substrate-binding protein
MRIVFSFLGFGLIAGFTALSSSLGWADDNVQLLPPDLVAPTTDKLIPVGKYKKAPPWTIGMSFPGAGNTWIIQMVQEIKYEAARTEGIKDFIFTEANWQPTKQVADMEDLIARKVDAIIIAPIAMPLVKKQVEAAVAAGIPVINLGWSKGALPTTVEVMGGGGPFGEVGGKWLKEKLNGKGTVWAFRGVPGVQEETDRYEGFKSAIAGSDITIGAEVFGEWNYAKSKGLCENLVLSGKPVDGIWFSGAEMTRACIDVFKAAGKPLVPMTGEGNNGFLRAWKENKLDSIAAVFTPQLGPAALRATVALLQGKTLYDHYFSNPPPITNANLDQYYRPDLNDAFWVPSSLPKPEIEKTFAK